MTQTLFTDTAGLIPATWGNSVARIADSKGVGGSIGPLRPSVQANAALRGVLGRAPVAGRRNLLTLTEFQTGLNGAPVRGGFVSATAFSGLTDNTGLAIGYDGVSATFAYKTNFAAPQTTYVFSVFVRMSDGLAPVFSNTSALNDFALVVGGTFATPSTYTVQDIGAGLYRVLCTLTTPASISENNTGVLKLNTNTSRTFTTSGWQLEVGSVATPHQRVNSALDVTEANLPSPAYLRLDLVDDVIPWAAPDGLSGDVLVIGRRGSWIERDVTVAAGGTLSVGPTTIAGRVPGILHAVGDIVAVIPVDRTISQTELDRLIAYYRPLGGKGLLTAGAELVTNGTFNTDLSGWTQSANTPTSLWEWSSGAARCVSGGSPFVALSQAILTAGRMYLLTLDVSVTRGGLKIGSSLNGDVIDITPGITASGSYSFAFVALTANFVMGRMAFWEATDLTVDNISVREITAS